MVDFEKVKEKIEQQRRLHQQVRDEKEAQIHKMESTMSYEEGYSAGMQSALSIIQTAEHMAKCEKEEEMGSRCGKPLWESNEEKARRLLCDQSNISHGLISSLTFEKLAEKMHDLWWNSSDDVGRDFAEIRYFFELLLKDYNKKDLPKIPKRLSKRVDRWNEECFMPYSKLSEKMKKIDRKVAWEVLNVLGLGVDSTIFGVEEIEKKEEPPLLYADKIGRKFLCVATRDKGILRAVDIENNEYHLQFLNFDGEDSGKEMWFEAEVFHAQWELLGGDKIIR